MVAYVVRRALFLPVIWLAMTMAIFVMLAPLGPYQRLVLYVRSDPDTMASRIGPEGRQRLIEKYGLDDPFLVQYRRWLGQVLHGDLGWSKTAQAPVAQALAERLPATIELALFAAVPMIGLAIWLGVSAAVHHKGWRDHSLRFLSITGSSLPSFVLGILLLMVFYGGLQWFPPGRLSLWAEQAVYAADFHRYTGLNTVDGLLNSRLDITADALRHLILPVITLAVVSWAALMRITRTSMLETLGQQYVTTARAKGLPERDVIYKHARRNAMIPVVTISTSLLVGLLTGVVITETVFNYKGIGFWAVQATGLFDVPAVIGVALFVTTFVVLGNLVADILYTIVDPRVRY